jgi:SAM-dependent methyltransferase
VAEKGRVFQTNQPAGVPALEMTGERTLPDVAQENYWYQRHVAVYEWVAQRVVGKRVIDMACGEGYGSDILARGAAQVVGVDANPEAYDHARLRYVGPNLRFARELIEEFDQPAEVVVFLQTIEHVADPEKLLRHFSDLVAEAYGEVVISTPNLLTLAPPGASKSDNPWHVKEYRPQEFAQLLSRHFERVDLFGLYHAGKLRLHARLLELIRLDRDLMHKRTGWARPFYARFVPLISVSDFSLRPVTTIAELDDALDLIGVGHH